MNTNLKAGMNNLSGIFSQQPVLRIPDYQRGYAWGEEQLRAFWDDVVNLREGKAHYTGLIALQPFEKDDLEKLDDIDRKLVHDGIYEAFNVVDGQQRITTTIIFLNELINFIYEKHSDKKEEEVFLSPTQNIAEARKRYFYIDNKGGINKRVYIFGYNNPEMFSYWKKCIFDDEEPANPKDTYYTKNIENAKRFFSEQVRIFFDVETEANDEEKALNRLSDIYQTITTKLKFNVYIVDEEYDVFVTFETMNNRGKKLSNLELFKNRLIYLTTLYDSEVLSDEEKKSLRKSIDDAWKEIYSQLGKMPNCVLSDDDYLRAHWIMYYKYTRNKGDDYIKDLLKRFSPDKIYKEKSKNIIQDSLELKDSFEETDDIIVDVDEEFNEDYLDKFLQPGQIQEYVKSLGNSAKYWCATFFPYEDQNEAKLNETQKKWIDKMNKMGMQFFRNIVFSIMVCNCNIDTLKSIAILENLEKLNFIAYKLGRFRQSEFDSKYNGYARKLYNKYERKINKPDEVIQVDELLVDLQNDINSISGKAIEEFVYYIEKKFSLKKDDVGYYQWDALNYFMYEYEQSLRDNKGSTIAKDLMWDSLNKKQRSDFVSKEHIFPRVDEEYDYWEKQFGGYSKDEKKALKGALGNLLPLSQSRNTKVSNRGYDDKKQTPAGDNPEWIGYKDGCYSEREVVDNYDDWDAESICDRSRKLLEFMQNRWGIKLSDEEMNKLIYVEAHFS